ncbi:MAG TPA: antibiotic biosynthesis monooxygenase [Desulfomonilia bacterium]|nr:antibiotic biosynthesis monooxygenase [Desulfomonilia bacterium]
MVIVHVFIHVKQDKIESFRNASSENARNSVLEPGIARFDVIQQKDDPARFVLVEVYRSETATSEHKQTSHYKKWKDTIEAMMAEPRYSIRYTNIFPDDNAF